MSETKQSRSEMFNLEHMQPSADSPLIEVIGEPKDRASLFTKLVQVNKSIKRLQATGKFSAGQTNYKYATEADVIEPISKALADAGLAIIPSVVEQWWHDMPGKYGTNRMVTVRAQLMIGDSDSGAYATAHTYSTAANQDKASNAAFTTALKYLLAKLALVAFGDDADDYTITGDKASSDAPKKKTSNVTKKELDNLQKLVVDKGMNDQVKDFLRTNNISWSKMTKANIEQVKLIIGE